MALSNAQLLMLDNLIYTDYCWSDMKVSSIVSNIKRDMASGKFKNRCEMSYDDWNNLISKIEADSVLMGYSVRHGNDEVGAAFFIDNPANPKDVNVVFRGTTGGAEWHDNGVGGYSIHTDFQEEALKYVKDIVKVKDYGNDITVTGHSKGGNKAQYVTLMTDDIFGRCVSFDGQGFSEEFIKKYEDEIAKKSSKIVSISAAKDFVNPLLYPIAGERIYIETQNFGLGVKNYHRPDILLDESGKLRPQGEQSEWCEALNKYTRYYISSVEEPERSIAIDGLLAILEDKPKENKVQTIAGVLSALFYADKGASTIAASQFANDIIDFTGEQVECFERAKDFVVDKGTEFIEDCIDDFNKAKDFVAEKGSELIEDGAAAINYLKEEGFDVIRETYGVAWGTLLSTMRSVSIPYLYFYELQHIEEDTSALTPDKMRIVAEEIGRKTAAYDSKTTEYGKQFVQMLNVNKNKLTVSKSGVASSRSGYVAADGGILIDTQSMRNYVTRLRRLSNTIMTTRSNIISLAADSRNPGLSQVAYMEAMQNYSRWLNNTADYLTQTAADFENIEREIKGQI